MRALHKTIGLVLVFFLLPAASRGDTVTLVASRDNTIYQGSPNNSNGAGQGMFVGNTGQGSATRALIGFDIASNVPPGSTITGVQLRLVLDQAATNDAAQTRQIQLCRLLADWGEGYDSDLGVPIFWRGALDQRRRRLRHDGQQHPSGRQDPGYRVRVGFDSKPGERRPVVAGQSDR